MMKKRIVWIGVLLLGTISFILPFLSGLYKMSIESWTMFDWVVMYSFLYWPSYLIGIIAIPLSIFNLLRQSI